jgi:hypothetical protein
MSVLAIKSPYDMNIHPVIDAALSREKNILKNSIRISEKRVKALATRLSVDTNQVIAGKVIHREDQDMELIELEGELEILKRHEQQLTLLESIAICD